MNHGKQIRREIGRQLGAIRRRKGLLLSKVAQDNNMGSNMLDEIEMGFIRPWIFYHRLREYYGYDICLVEKKQ